MTETTAPNIDNLRVNTERILGSWMKLAQIYATHKGGVGRLTLTDLRQSRPRLSDPLSA